MRDSFIFWESLALDTTNHQNMVRDLFMSLECGASLIFWEYWHSILPVAEHGLWLICVIRMWCVTDFLRALALHTINHQNMVCDLFVSLECGAWLIFWEHWHYILSITIKNVLFADCNTLQHTATHCNIVQHTARYCNTQQHAATYWHTAIHCNTLRHTATRCTTLYHTATHCSTLQHTATHCNTLQHSATRCNTLQHNATHCNTHLCGHLRLELKTHCNTLQNTATHCNTLQHAATHYNTIQHTATHCNTLQHTAT